MDQVWNVRLRSVSGGPTRAFVRKSQIDIERAIDFDEKSSSICALEYVLAGIGGDLLSGLERQFRKARIEGTQFEAQVQATLNNPLIHLEVVGEGGDPSIKSIVVKVYISSLTAPEEIEALWQETLKRSPLIATFTKLSEFEVSYKIVF